MRGSLRSRVKNATLQISLKSSRGLRSRNPRSPINIWPWTPPVRQRPRPPPPPKVRLTVGYIEVGEALDLVNDLYGSLEKPWSAIPSRRDGRAPTAWSTPCFGWR